MSEPPIQRRITSTRAKAKMVYLPPDLDLEALILQTPNFKTLPRLDATQLVGQDAFEALAMYVQQHVIDAGLPLVIEKWHERPDWPHYMFNPDWLKQNHGRDRKYPSTSVDCVVADSSWRFRCTRS